MTMTTRSNVLPCFTYLKAADGTAGEPAQLSCQAADSILPRRSVSIIC